MSIQERRARMTVPVGPGGKVHDYVPFYFSSMNPMLLTLLNKKNVDQNMIIYLCVKIDRLESDDAVFTDSSANRNDAPVFYEDVTQLDQLDWDLIDSKRWNVGTDEAKHKKMAEALIHRRVGIDEIEAIVVYNKRVKKATEKIFENNGIKPPAIIFDGDRIIRNYHFYYTKFYIKGQELESLVTGPLSLKHYTEQAITEIIELRSKRKGFNFATINDLVNALCDNFATLPELKELIGLKQNYYPHNDSVDTHTINVVAEIKNTTCFRSVSNDTKAILLIAAYLHDIGKGPKSKWKNGIMNNAYPDHPADAIPMLKRILSEEIADLSNEDIRKICMLVFYHDIVGDCIANGRDKQQIANIITCEEDLDLLFAISIADTRTIMPTWANTIESQKNNFCKEIIEIKKN